MRKLFTIIATMLLWTVSLFAQAPQKMAYQAVVRDAEGKVITNQELGVQVSILQGSVDGTSVYSESHTTTSTSTGAINIEIGGGETSDDFSAIDWSKGPYFIQSTTEVNGKSVTVTSQLLSVPYALYAENVNEATFREMVLKVLDDNGYTPADKKGGVLPGKFSINDSIQISFAMGNLQYQASTNTWRFAENQYDMVGYDNKKVSSTYSGWIDLFGWGTSGLNDRYPYLTSTDYSDYGYYGHRASSIAGTKYDWGRKNAISNGGNEAGMWRTLTSDEWEYILILRPNAEKLSSTAVVNGVNGYLLLPDGWTTPNRLTFTANAEDFITNIYDESAWNRMESSGAVFLPCAGFRTGLNVFVGSYGDYWTSTANDSSDADNVHIYSGNCTLNHSNRSFGYSVRLATE